LHDPEECCFQITRQATNVLGHVQPDANFAAVSESFHVPPNSGTKTRFVQEKRMKQV